MNATEVLADAKAAHMMTEGEAKCEPEILDVPMRLLVISRWGHVNRPSKWFVEPLQQAGWEVVFFDVTQKKPMYGVPEWIAANGPISAWLWWEEHGCLFVDQNTISFMRWSRKHGIVPLSSDYGYLYRRNFYLVDRYDERGRGLIHADWPTVSDAPIDWENEAHPQVQAWRKGVLDNYAQAQTQDPIREPGYVAVWTQFSPRLSRLKAGRGVTWPEWCEKVHERLTAAGERVVFKESPYEKPTEFPDSLDVIPHVAEENVNARLATHAKYNLLVSTSLTNELILAELPVLTTGRSWFHGLDVFDEAGTWDDIGRMIPTVNQPSRNKYLRWWLQNQVHYTEIGRRATAVVKRARAEGKGLPRPQRVVIKPPRGSGIPFTIPQWQPRRKVVYTVVTNNHDTVWPHPDIPGWDFIAFTDGTPVANWTPRHFVCPGLFPEQAARCPRILAHRWLPDYDYSVYHDGPWRLIVDPMFYLAKSSWPGYRLRAQGDRDCIYDELRRCTTRRLVKKGRPEQEIAMYRAEGIPEHLTLYNTQLLFRRHNAPEAVAFGEAWWKRYAKAQSRRDQASFAITCHDTGFQPTTFEYAERKQWMTPSLQEECPRHRLAHFEKVLPAWREQVKTCLYVGAHRKRMHLVPMLTTAGVSIDVVEPFEPYRVGLRKVNARHHCFDQIIAGDVRDLAAAVGKRKYDLVLWWHGPEHVDEAEVARGLAQCAEHARAFAVVGAPHRHRPQKAIDGNEQQRHRWDVCTQPFEECGWKTSLVRDGRRGREHLIAWKKMSAGGKDE